MLPRGLQEAGVFDSSELRVIYGGSDGLELATSGLTDSLCRWSRHYYSGPELRLILTKAT